MSLYASDKDILADLTKDLLTYLSQRTLPLPPENIRNSYGSMMFSGGRERLHWQKMS